MKIRKNSIIVLITPIIAYLLSRSVYVPLKLVIPKLLGVFGIIEHSIWGITLYAANIAISLLLIFGMGYVVGMLAITRKTWCAMISGIVYGLFDIAESAWHQYRIYHKMTTDLGRSTFTDMIPAMILIALVLIILYAGIAAFGGWIASRRVKLVLAEEL